MREIKFRGLSKHGYFVYGFLVTNSNFDAVIAEWFEHGPTQEDPCGGVSSQYTVVDEKTVGQYTGLKDKNGVELYEGDILSAGKGITGVMEWHEDRAEFSKFMPMHKFEVIGNIYQNTELLEK